MSVAIRYGGTPRPVRSIWGTVGFEELSNGALVAGQPNGSPSWFPCDDHPSAKASYRIKVSTDSPISRANFSSPATPTRAHAWSTASAVVSIGAAQKGQVDSPRRSGEAQAMQSIS